MYGGAVWWVWQCRCVGGGADAVLIRVVTYSWVLPSRSIPRRLPCTTLYSPHPPIHRVLDKTKTKCGARLLRANLLQPLQDAATLNARCGG